MLPQRHPHRTLSSDSSHKASSSDPAARLYAARLVFAASIALLLLALVPICVPTSPAAATAPLPRPIYLRFPYSCIFFAPLLIPLTTYLVIARWTGEKHYRHS